MLLEADDNHMMVLRDAYVDFVGSKATLELKAQELGANAVVGVDIDYEVLGQGNGMLMVSASGTAVVVD